MARKSLWVEVVCEYKVGEDWCNWRSFMGKPGELKVMWRDYREHKRKEHSERCKVFSCRFIDDKHRCLDEGCVKGGRKVD